MWFQRLQGLLTLLFTPFIVSIKQNIEFVFASFPGSPSEHWDVVQGFIRQNFAARHLLDGVSSFFSLRDFKQLCSLVGYKQTYNK